MYIVEILDRKITCYLNPVFAVFFNYTRWKTVQIISKEKKGTLTQNVLSGTNFSVLIFKYYNV